jgi:hypothetical protein
MSNLKIRVLTLTLKNTIRVLYIRVKYKMEKDMVSELCCITIKLEYMKDPGVTIQDMVKAMSDIKMEIYLRVNLLIIKHMEKESINGLMVRCMMENGWQGRNMVMVSGEECMEIVTLESGKIVKLKDMEFIYGKMVINTKGNG